MHEVSDELLQAPLLVYYYHGRVEHFLEDPHIPVVLKKHCEETLLEVTLEYFSVFLAKIEHVPLYFLVFLARWLKLFKDELIEMVDASAAISLYLKWGPKHALPEQVEYSKD